MQRTEHRFVVRMWREPGPGPEGQWRGAVDHIGHERRLYFTTLSDLTDFIRARMAAGEPEVADHAET